MNYRAKNEWLSSSEQITYYKTVNEINHYGSSQNFNSRQSKISEDLPQDAVLHIELLKLSPIKNASKQLRKGRTENLKVTIKPIQ